MVAILFLFFLQDALVSDPGNSSVGSNDPLKSSTSDLTELNGLNGSSSDLLDHDEDDVDEDSDYAGDEDDYLSDCDDFAYNDVYASLQSQFDNVDLPPGVEASVPWLKDPSTSGKDSSTSGNVPATKTLTISDFPVSKREEAASCSLAVHAELSSDNKVVDSEDDVMQKYLQFKQFDVVNDFSDHHYFRTESEGKQVRLIT